jgi:glycosyltransferase involved in cell wall biosynthesis
MHQVLREKISVIVPAYNESALIAHNVREIQAAFSAFAPDCEIILIDDGSIDETWRRAAEADRSGGKSIRILRYERNMGKGYALACGTRHANGQYIVFLDADLDLHPDQIPRFFDQLLRDDADAVIGSKWHPQSHVTYPGWRRLLSRGYYALTHLLFGLPLRDTQTGLKLFRAAPLKAVVPRLLAKRFAFDIELLTVMHRSGYRIVEAPVDVRFRRALPRLNLRDAWYVLVDTMAIFYRVYLRRYYDRIGSASPQVALDVTEIGPGAIAEL